MKTLILYTSKCGSTKKYCEDIAKQVSADVFILKGFKTKKMLPYDTIVYGGWIRGNTIQGLDKFLQSYPEIKTKNVIVFAVGMGIPTPESRSLLIEQNLLDLYHIRFYQFRGSFDIAKLDVINKFMINNSLKMILNDPASSPDQKSLTSIKDHPIDYYDQDKVNKVVSVLNQLSFDSVFQNK